MNTIILISTLLAVTAANEIWLFNNCPFTVWPGIRGIPGKGQPENGGFRLGQYESKSIYVATNWAGSVWGRTNCDDTGRCETGDCGNKIQCNGAGGAPPVSLAEVTLKGYGGIDYYDISLVDGYNLPIAMMPFSGYSKTSFNRYECTVAGCRSDLNSQCPAELAVVNSAGWTYACESACSKFNTDQYCCRGAYNTPQTCKSSDWPVNYPAIFKRACPDAYSYAYDDTTLTFTCRGNPYADYAIIFCP